MTQKIDIEKRTEELLKTYNVNADNGVDIIGLAQKMEFIVGNAGLDDTEDGFILVNENSEEILGIKTKRLIGVNADRDVEYKRFIIAHELGHYILTDKKNIFAHRENRRGKNKQENDADFFAACILMPKLPFENHFNALRNQGIQYSKIMSKLQQIFSVPLESVLRRVDELNLIQDNANG